MHAFRRALIVTSALYGAPATAQPLVAHFEDVHDWHVTAAQSADVARVAAGFSAFGRQFDMELEANPAVVREFTTVARAYRGRLRGADRSWVRIVVSPDGPAGIIWDGVTLYGIEAGGAGMLPAIFRADDVIASIVGCR